MNRRKFLSLASFAGMSVASLDAFGRPARPGSRAGLTPLSETYGGPLFLTIRAAGGWDPTSLCDPKGSASDTDLDAMNWSFRSRDIGTTASGIRYAPAFERFFEKHGRRLLVINGVDMATCGHDAGARQFGAGLPDEGSPTFAALVAAIHGHDLPAQHPERPESRDDEPAIFQPRSAVMYASRTGADELRKLQQYLPDLGDGANPLIRQIQVAMAAYRAGITVAADLELDGFDTHEDHDATHIPRLGQLLAGVDFAVDEAARQGIADDVVIVVGSEFGRSPGYNSSNGKDHWPVNSVMALGAGIRGGRVVGATTERHEARAIDPRTLAVSDRGVRIEPRHIHHNLRRLAGIDGAALAQRYPLDLEPGDEIDLLGT